MKEEEQARKKAEEKARKEAIFQQYLQKKLDQDEEKSPPSVAVTRRERANQSQPRPKSMFAKARPLPDHDSLASGGMATHSSQEDLSSQASPPGSTGRGVRPVHCRWGKGVGWGVGKDGEWRGNLVVGENVICVSNMYACGVSRRMVEEEVFFSLFFFFFFSCCLVKT